MLELNRQAKVMANGQLACILSKYTDKESKRVVFQYSSDYLKNGSPIGHHFPLTSIPFESDELPNFFENLAIEGYLREVQCERSEIVPEDTLGLLLENGKELVGAISIVPHRLTK